MKRKGILALALTLALLFSASFCLAEEANQTPDAVWAGYERGINFGNWLCQCSGTREHYDTYVTEADFKRVAAWGLDHVRLPFSYLVIEKYGFTYLDRAVTWAENAGLNIILDMHKAPAYDFDNPDGPESTLFLYEDRQEEFAAYWKMIAEHYKDKGDRVAFELLNEVTDEAPVVWNKIITRAVAAIREVSPDRYIVVGGVRWNSIDALDSLVKLDDERVIYTFHAYEPFALTHQNASWVERMTAFNRQMSYPAALEDYRAYLAFTSGDMRSLEGLERMDAAYLENYFKTALTFRERRGCKLYVGEWGCINSVDAASRRAYHRDMAALLRRYHLGGAVWNYSGDATGSFSLTDPDTRAILDDAIVRILGAKTEAEIGAVDTRTPVPVDDGYVFAVREESARSYVIQTSSYWGDDGGWMMNKGENAYDWTDNEYTAAAYGVSMWLDEAVGEYVGVTASENSDAGLLYCMYALARLPVTVESGVLEMDAYLSDPAALKSAPLVIELISGANAWMGTSSLQWRVLDGAGLTAGWNRLVLPFSEAEAIGRPFDPEQLKFLWFCADGFPSGAEVRLANIRIHGR